MEQSRLIILVVLLGGSGGAIGTGALFHNGDSPSVNLISFDAHVQQFEDFTESQKQELCSNSAIIGRTLEGNDKFLLQLINDLRDKNDQQQVGLEGITSVDLSCFTP